MHINLGNKFEKSSEGSPNIIENAKIMKNKENQVNIISKGDNSPLVMDASEQLDNSELCVNSECDVKLVPYIDQINKMRNSKKDNNSSLNEVSTLLEMNQRLNKNRNESYEKIITEKFKSVDNILSMNLQNGFNLTTFK